jgi:hypothetical protein
MMRRASISLGLNQNPQVDYQHEAGGVPAAFHIDFEEGWIDDELMEHDRNKHMGDYDGEESMPVDVRMAP